MPFEMTLSAFARAGWIPQKYTCDGQNLSPAIEWSGEPAGTAGFALIVDDPDAPAGTWNHWLLYDLPGNVHRLEEAAPAAGLTGINDFRRPGYGGPCPPRGHGPHLYFFRLYAVDVPSLGLKEGARRGELNAALRGHILAETEWVGRYERR